MLISYTGGTTIANKKKKIILYLAAGSIPKTNIYRII